MSLTAIRRAYLYLAALFSLQATVWAAIGLLRNVLVVDETSREAIAFQIAVVVVALPIYLVHWRRVQVGVSEAREERASHLRTLYLYATLALLLSPFLTNLFDLLQHGAAALLDAPFARPAYLSPRTALDVALRSGAALVVLAAVGAYHWRVVRRDEARVAPRAASATIRRLFVLAYSAVGVLVTTLASVHLVRWISLQMAPSAGAPIDAVALSSEIARVLVGLPLWLVFWRWAGALFEAREAERRSAFRKLYLYAMVFIGLVASTSNLALIIAGGLRRALGLEAMGDIRGPLPVVLVLPVLWVYHARVVEHDAARVEEAVRQARIRRVYSYLVTAVAFGALLLGLGGLLRVLVRALAEGFVPDLQAQLAWFSAAIAVGLPLWLVYWRRVQRAATAKGPDGDAERSSLVRRIYLYFYLFVAVITVLSGAVFVLFQLLRLVLGIAPDPAMWIELSEAGAYAVLGAAVMALHAAILRDDGRHAAQRLAAQLAALRVVVVDAGAGELGAGLSAALRSELPQLNLTALATSEPAATAMDGRAVDAEPLGGALAEADVVVTRADLVLAPDDPVARAILESDVRLLLVPVETDRQQWVGVEARDAEDTAEQVTHAVRQLAVGERVTPAQPLTAGQMIGLAVAALLLFVLVVVPIVGFVAGPGLGYLFE